MPKTNFYLKGSMSKSKMEALKKENNLLYQEYLKKPLPLQLYCSVAGKRLQIPLGKSIPPIAWDGNSRVKQIKDARPWQELNSFIAETEQKTLKWLNSNEAQKGRITNKDLKSAINGEYAFHKKVKDESRSILDVFNEFIQSKKTVQGFPVADATVKKYKTAKNHLEEYISFSKRANTIADIDEDFMNGFKEHLYKNGRNDNTVCKYYKVILELLRYLKRKGFNIESELLKFGLCEYAPPVIIVELKELNDLSDLKIEDPKLEKIRDVFIFMAFTGQRFSDIYQLAINDITEKDGSLVWILNTQKTRQTIIVPINEYAASILNKYRSKPTLIPKFSNQYFNRRLKDLAYIANLERMVPIEKRVRGEVIKEMKPLYKVISSHMARKSFITNGLIMGMTPEEIKTISGHKDDKSFRRYVQLADYVIKRTINIFSKENVVNFINTN